MSKTIQDHIAEAHAEIERLYAEQNKCVHVWTEPKYNPEATTRSEIRTGDYSQCHGSDNWPAFDTYPAIKDRWSRECKHCGKIEYTYEFVKPVVYGPKFGN